MTIFFTSDLHFDHVNIIGYTNRPYNSVPHMNKSLIANYNDVVTDDDTVYILGDACMGKIKDSLPYLACLKGKKILVPGNHDRCHSMYAHKQTYQEYYDLYARYVGIANEQVQIEEFIACHFPYELGMNDSHTRPELEHFSPSLQDKSLLCGHVHNSWKIRKATNGAVMFNVGVDVNDYRPVSIDEIRAQIATANL